MLANLAVFLLVAQTFKNHKRLRNSVFLISLFALFAASTFFYVPFAYGGVHAYYDAGLDAIIVYWDGLAGPSPFNLTDVNNDIADATILNETSPGVWWLNASLESWDSTEFQITEEDCAELRINSLATRQREIRYSGLITINNTAIYGWESGTYDTDPSNGRSKLLANISDYCDEFYARNTTFAYLGNGTVSTGYNYEEITDNSAVYVRIPIAASYNATIDGCVFHNCSTVFIYGNMLNCTVKDTEFYDMNNNVTLFTKYPYRVNIESVTFDNATELFLHDTAYANGSIDVQHTRFLNQWNDNHQIIRTERSSNITFYNVTINNCKNNSVQLRYETVNITFNELYMNNTALENAMGIITVSDGSVSHVTLVNSTFETVMTVNLRWTSHAEIDNCTFIGNYLGQWQVGFQTGNWSNIHDCHVYNCSFVGLQAGADSIIKDNYAEECGTGILIYPGTTSTYLPTSNVTIQDNILSNMSYSIDAWSVGIRLHGQLNGSVTDVLVDNNTIEGGNAGILLCMGVEDVSIQNNNISIMPWGTGGAYLPINYTRPGGVSGWRNESDYRVIAGIALARQWGVSWNWTKWKNYNAIRNVTLSGNTYNGTYMQAYVWVDKTDAYNDSTITGSVDVSGFSDDYFEYEYTDSYFNGCIIYANPNNPIYRYNRADGSITWGNTTYFLTLNSSYVETRIPQNISQTVDFSWYWGGDIVNSSATVSLRQNYDNISRTMRLHNVSATEKSCVYQTVHGGWPAIIFNTTGPSGNVSYWLSNSSNYGEPLYVYFNNVEDTVGTHWSFSAASNSTLLNWTHSSEVDVEIVYLMLSAPTIGMVNISDMEGCGDWVFAEEKYYTFNVYASDANGYTDLDHVRILFTDGLELVYAWYDQAADSYKLYNGLEIVNLKAGTATAINTTTLRVTFLFYFKNKVLDADDVDLYGWANDTSGLNTSWIQFPDYFNIYNQGGHSNLTVSGDAGRLPGGDVFDLYAYNNSYAEASIIFRKLQHIKLLPIINMTIRDPIAANNAYTLEYIISYCNASDDWQNLYRIRISCRNGSGGGTEQYMRWRVTHWRGNPSGSYSQIKAEDLYCYSPATSSPSPNIIRFWIDIWFNKINASTYMGGRINAYYFPMHDSSNLWLRWLTGNNWGPNDELQKESMAFIDMLKYNNESVIVPLHSQEIKLVKVTCRVVKGIQTTADDVWMVHFYEVFDLTFSPTPTLEGIQTPVFDETKVPMMPQGGFLGTLVSMFLNGLKGLADFMGPALLDFFYLFADFLDSVAAAVGLPAVFTTLLDYLVMFWTWAVDSLEYLVSMLGFIFETVIGPTISKFINLLISVVTQWINMLQVLFDFLGGAYTGGLNLWSDLNLGTWIMVGAILYPLYLVFLWEQRGMTAVIAQLTFIKDIIFTLAHFFLAIVQFFINLIGRIIESIPIVE